MVADIASAIGTAITTASTIYEISKNSKDSELQLKISELNVILAQTQNQIAELLAENRRLNELLEQEKDNPLTFDKASGFYIDRNGVYYCPGCYDKTKSRSHLRKVPLQIFDSWKCHVCKQTFYGS